MKVSTIRAVKVAGLVGLPLIALLAVALFFTLGNSTTDTAEAAGPGAGMALVVPTNVEVGSKFTIGLVTNPEPSAGIAGFAAEILVPNPALAYNGASNCAAEVKVTLNGLAPALCQSVVTAANTPTVGARGLVVLGAIGAPPAPLLDNSPGIVGLANLSYTCNTTGVHTVTLTANPASADGAAYSAADLSLVLVKSNPADTAQITCTEPAGTISITKTDSDTGAALGGTCWTVASVDPSGVQTVVGEVGDNGKAGCGAAGGLSDGNAAAGSIDITIDGKLRLSNGDNWFVTESQAPVKYNADSAVKAACNFGGATPNSCSVNATNTLSVGTINATWVDKVDGSFAGDPAQCYTFNATTNCDNDAADKNMAVGVAEHNVAFGVQNCTLDATSIPTGRIIDAAQGVATQNCDTPDSTAAGRKATVSWAYAAAVPQWQKLTAGDATNAAGSNLANLFLTAQLPKLGPLTCEAGNDSVIFNEVLSTAITTTDPKAIDPKTGEVLTGAALQEIAGFEVEVRFDSKIVCVSLAAGPAAASMTCVTKNLDGIASIHCATQKGTPKASGLLLATLEVKPQPDVYSFIIANQENGIVTQLIDQDCKLTDSFGHPIPILSCEDAELTVRFLEGDVNADCTVNALDQQQLAFRWGSSLGNLIYNARYDLEPSASVGANTNGDGDIDINDLQFVFGRHLSQCSAPNPAQPPVNGKTP